MSFNTPSPPDPYATSQAQQGYNLQAAQQQQKVNEISQSSPYGNLTYLPDPNSPSGYSLQTSLSPQQQQLLNLQTGTQATAGQTAQSALRNAASMYSNPYDLSATAGATGKYLQGLQQQYVNPIFGQQQSNLDAKLVNQGLTPGSESYNNAQNLLARNQGDVNNQFLMQMEPQAFSQALQQYGLPLQTVGSLFGMSGPTGPTMLNTPTAQIQPANYAGAAQNAYQGQLSNYENTWNNIAKLGAAGIGLAGAPFTGGLSLGLAGGLGSMFGGTPGATAANSGSVGVGGYQMPTIGYNAYG